SVEKRNNAANGTTAAAPSAQPPLLTQEGWLHATYSAAANTISFTQSFVQAGQTRIDLDGTISKTASLQVRVQSNELAGVEVVASAFGAMPQPLGLGGMTTFAGTIRGSASDPQITGQLSATSLKVKDTEWRTVRADVDAGPSQITLRNAEVTPGTG